MLKKGEFEADALRLLANHNIALVKVIAIIIFILKSTMIVHLRTGVSSQY